LPAQQPGGQGQLSQQHGPPGGQHWQPGPQGHASPQQQQQHAWLPRQAVMAEGVPPLSPKKDIAAAGTAIQIMLIMIKPFVGVVNETSGTTMRARGRSPGLARAGVRSPARGVASR